MTDTATVGATAAPLEEIQQGWRELTLRVGQLEAEKCALEQENKSLRFLLEKVIEHRQKSHSELVLLLTGLVSKLSVSDVGAIISKLVEHNTNVSEFLAALIKGTVGEALPQPEILKTLEQTKRDLRAALKPAVEELIQLDSPFEPEMLKPLPADPERFFSPAVVRANRCFVKGQMPKERIMKQFGEPALIFFNDMTTDPKLNPFPKPEEIVLSFKPDFEALFEQNPALIPDKKQELLALYQRVQRSKMPTDQCRAQKSAFAKLSFLIELLYFYEHQSTEMPDVIFAQRLPAVVEQLVLGGSQDNLDEKLITQAEQLMAFVISSDHRHMIINNLGKASAAAKNLKYVLKLRIEKLSEVDQLMPEFVKHLIPPPPQKPPTAEALTAILGLIKPEVQLLVVKSIMLSDRMRKEEAEALGRAIAAKLGLKDLDAQIKAHEAIPPEVERQLAWGRIKDLLARRSEPAALATAIRERLHAKYDAEEIKQSWMTLIEADPMSLIRVFCQLPYLPNGQTDPVARAVMEAYASRLIHEKYAAAYQKVVTSLKNMFKAKPDSPTLLNFLALVKWVSPEAATKLTADIGMPVHA